MADSLIVKLGADTSEFKGNIAGASSAFKQAFGAEAGSKIGEEFGRAFNRKIGVSDVARAALVSLGIDAKSIAENIARAWTGVSKEEEEAFKNISAIGQQVADEEIAHARERLTAAQRYKLLIQDQGRLQRDIDADRGNSAVALEKKLRDRQALLRVETEIGRELVNIEKERKEAMEGQVITEKTIADFEERIRKEKIENAKKATEADVEYYKKSARLDAELRKQKEEGLPAEQKIKAYQEDIAVLKKQQIGYDKADNEYKQRQIQINEINKNIELERLNIAKQTAAEAQKTVDIRSGSAGGDIGVLKSLSGFDTYNNAGQQRDYERGLITQARSEIQDQINELQDKINAYLKSGSSLGQYEIPALRERLSALQYRKQNVDQFVFNPNYSDKAGSGIFASQVSSIGDPLGLQKKQVDTLDKVSQGIADINNRLRVAGFGTGG